MAKARLNTNQYRSEEGFASFAKVAFKRFCFCLGFATFAYQSFAQIHHFFAGESAPQTSVFQDKVKNLFQNESNPAPEARAMSYIAKPSVVSAPASLASLAPVIEATAEASPSPSPAEGENKDGVQTAENAEATQGPEGVMAPPFMGNPYFNPGSWNPNQNASNDAPVNAEGQPIAVSPAFNSPNLGGTTVVSGNSGTTTSESSFAALNAQDIQALTSANVQATFADQQNHVTGYACSGTSASACSYQNDITVHSMRWGMQEGLKPGVNFAVSAASGNSPVQFDVSFQIQDQLLNDQTVNMTTQPDHVAVRSETRDTGTYKIYEFTMPDAVVRNDEHLVGVKAKLVYQVTETGMVMSPESNFTFNRDQVQTLGSLWNPGGVTPSGRLAGRAPSSTPNSSPATDDLSDLYFIADQLPYSMNLHTSP